MLKAMMWISSVLAVAPLAQAHEGHGVPGTLQAQHGGVIKATKELYVELVTMGKDLMIYPMTHEFKPVPLNEAKISATAKLPRAKKAEPVEFKPMPEKDAAKSHFHGRYDAKGAHRYELEVTLEYKGQKEKATFQVESK